MKRIIVNLAPADLESAPSASSGQAEIIKAHHLAEAIQYRPRSQV